MRFLARPVAQAQRVGARVRLDDDPEIYGASIPTTDRTVTVDYSRLRIQDLAETMSVLAKGDLFSVEIGPHNPRIPDVLSNRDNRYGSSTRCRAVPPHQP